MTSSSVKILVAYHKRSLVVRDGVYAPVLAGGAVVSDTCKDGRVFLGREFLEDIEYRDNAGENVSDLNRSINEMSVVYWAWKNYGLLGAPKYIGLVHYRRFFIADESLPLPGNRRFPGAEMYLYEKESVFRAAISSVKLMDVLGAADVLCPYRYAASELKGPSVRNCRDAFVNMMGEDKGFLYDEMERLVLDARPDFRDEIEYMRSHSDHYVCNMFVMPKEEFFRYCEFVFPVLFRLVELNKNERDVERMRAPGFLSEFLTSLYLSALVREGRLRVKPMRIACWGIPAHGFLRRVLRKILPDAARFKIRKLLRKF